MTALQRIILWTVLTLSVGGACRAQHVRLNPDNGRQALYFDLDRLVNYNRYEHWRWGGGIYWATPAPTLGPQWQIQAYLGYGVRDRRLKYGIDIARAYRAPHWWRPYIGFSDDLMQNQSAVINNAFSLLRCEENATLMTSQFVHQQALRAGVAGRWNRLQVMSELRYMRQRMLFDGNQSLYPALGDTVPDWYHLTEWHCQASRGGVTADFRVGTASETPDWCYLRLMIQYQRQFSLPAGDIEVFGQTGCALASNDSRTTSLHQSLECFDLGGTYNSHFYFRNSLLTLPPECFLADRFARSSVRYLLPPVLWRHRLSSPQPFIQASATWGRHYAHHEWSAVGEAAAGLSGLLLWQRLDLGCAVARQCLNTSSGNVSLRPNNRSKLWAFVVCAKMVI